MTSPCLVLQYNALESGLMQHLQSALGVFALIAFAWLISENRRLVSFRRAGIGLAVTVVLAVLFL